MMNMYPPRYDPVRPAHEASAWWHQPLGTSNPKHQLFARSMGDTLSLLCADLALDELDVRRALRTHYDVEHWHELTFVQLDVALDGLEVGRQVALWVGEEHHHFLPAVLERLRVRGWWEVRRTDAGITKLWDTMQKWPNYGPQHARSWMAQWAALETRETTTS